MEQMRLAAGQFNQVTEEKLEFIKQLGFLIADHVPHMVDDTPWGHRARAYALGYMKALLSVVDQLY